MLYCALTASQLDDLSLLVRCPNAVSLRLHQNVLLLNPSKTEAVLFATRQRLDGMDFSHTIKVASADIQFSKAVKLLDVTLDTTLLYHLISALPTSSVRVISTCSHYDTCDRRSLLSRQNRWQLPLSVLGLIIP